MQPLSQPTLERVLKWLVGLLIVKVTISVLLGYRDYFPPNFDSDFLWGREAYFWGAYRYAFYAHIASGPLSLLLGLVLVSDRVRTRHPTLHRSLGKIQASIVLLALAPSGLWMAFYAAPAAAAGFGTLAVATGACVALGWRGAVQRRFADHRRWMSRCFLLLCSAVVLRLIGGLMTVTNVGSTWTYFVAAWVSWLAPLALLEWQQWRRSVRSSAKSILSSPQTKLPLTSEAMVGRRQSAPSAVTLSSPAIETSARR
jgi:hypothetical protein